MRLKPSHKPRTNFSKDKYSHKREYYGNKYFFMILTSLIKAVSTKQNIKSLHVYQIIIKTYLLLFLFVNEWKEEKF